VEKDALGPSWLVLRCPPAATERLETDLRGFNLAAWTPRFRTLARTRHTRRKKAIEMIALPSFVFLGEKDLEEARGLYATGQIGKFHVFAISGVRVLLSEKDLEGLRAVDQEQEPQKPKRFEVGQKITVTSGPFAGRAGEVLKPDGAYYYVELAENKLRMKIPPFLLA